MDKAGFEVDYCRYLNLLGVLGWWWNGKVMKRKIIPKGQIMIYDRIVWFSQKVERFLPKPIGFPFLRSEENPANEKFFDGRYGKKIFIL